MKPGTSAWQRFPWRTLLVVMGLFVVARWWVIESLLVPSDSMEPLVHGDPVEGDRVLVFKPYYRFRSPQRFDLVVFHPPKAQLPGQEVEEYMINRVAALGGEQISIRKGDLYVASKQGSEPEILRKDYSDFSRMFISVWNEDFRGDLDAHWRLQGEGIEVLPAGLRVRGSGDPEESLACLWRRPIDSGVVDARGVHQPGSHAVDDVLLRTTFTAGSNCSYVARLNESKDFFWFVLETEGEQGRVSILHQTATGAEWPVTASRVGLRAGQRSVIEVWNVDDVLGIAVNGVVELTVAHAPVQAALGSVRIEPAFGISAGEAVFHRAEIERDLYYTAPEGVDGTSWPVPADKIFVLGDHSEVSRDSRHFGPVAEAELVGRPVAVCYPWDRLKFLD